VSAKDKVQTLSCSIFSVDDDSVAILLESGSFLTVGSDGSWRRAAEPAPVQLAQQAAQTKATECSPPVLDKVRAMPVVKAVPVTVPVAGKNQGASLRKCPGCNYAVTWHPTHCCQRCKNGGGGNHGPKCERKEVSADHQGETAGLPPVGKGAAKGGKGAKGGRRHAEPEAEVEPEVAGWGEDVTAAKPGRRGNMGQLAAALRVLRREDEAQGAVRFMRTNPDCMLFLWVERMALCVGNAGHDARNNLRFAKVSLERRAQRFANGGRVRGLGHVGGMGMLGGGMMMMGRRVAQVEENPNHPRNLDAEYFRRIDALSGQVEGLCRGIVTKARQHRRPAIRERLIPAALTKINEMEDLTRRTDGSDQEESQRAEMIRIINLQRQYLQALDSAIGTSSAQPGLPRPDEILDFSVANAEVEQQLQDLTRDLDSRSHSLKPDQTILLARIACNTGHQLQNIAAFCAEDPSCSELAKQIDKLGGDVENKTRNVMVVVHRQEDTHMIPITSKQNIAVNCQQAWSDVEEIAKIAQTECMRANASAPELAPTMARLRKAVKGLSESAITALENELSLPFGLFKPNLRAQPAPSAPAAAPRPADREGPCAQASAPTTASSVASIFDVVVVGAGPAGVAAAEAAAERGLRCAVIEPRSTGLGAATGFISKVAHTALVEAAASDTQSRQQLRRSLVQQGKDKSRAYGERTRERLRAAGIELWHGCGRLTGPHTVAVADFDSGEDWEVSANFIVICTGARPRHPPRCAVDARVVHDYRTIEEVPEQLLPKSVVILGGGVIACETASHMAEFGVQTTVLSTGELLKSTDALAAESLTSHLRQSHGVQLVTNVEIASVSSDGATATVSYRIPAASKSGGAPTNGSASKSVSADAVVVAMGSVPNTEWLGLETAGVELDDRGAVKVNDDMRSNVPHIFACGDCCSQGGLLSLAKRQGLLAASALHRDKSKIWTAPVPQAPTIIWTVPEIASIGAMSGRVGTYEVVTNFCECDRGILDAAHKDFFLKIVYEVQNLPTKVYIRGVHIYGLHAERLIALGAGLLGKTLEEAMAMPLAAAATLEELYTLNLQKAAKRTVEVGAQRSEGCLTS